MQSTCLVVVLLVEILLCISAFRLSPGAAQQRSRCSHSLQMAGLLDGKLALVTGSTSGIGLGIARSLAAEGANIVITGSSSAEALHTLATSLADEFKVKVGYQRADLSKAEEIEAMMTRLLDQHGVIDILVNNAGIQHVAPIDEFPVDKWNAIMNINLNAMFHTTRLALPAMKKQNWGRIINISSVHGLVASAGKAPYVATKHAIVGFSKAVALETAKTKVTANALCPGWVLTPLVQKQIDDRAAAEHISVDDARVKLIAEKQPSGMPVTSEQLGALVVFLASENGSEVRGAAWNVDGGWVAQ
eukprot:gene1913-2091_t